MVVYWLGMEREELFPLTPSDTQDSGDLWYEVYVFLRTDIATNIRTGEQTDGQEKDQNTVLEQCSMAKHAVVDMLISQINCS